MGLRDCCVRIRGADRCVGRGIGRRGLWNCGIMELWNCGIMGLRDCCVRIRRGDRCVGRGIGRRGLWNYGIMGLWNYGIVELGGWGIGRLGDCGSVGLGECGSGGLGDYGIVGLRDCGIMGLWDCGRRGLGECGSGGLRDCGVRNRRVGGGMTNDKRRKMDVGCRIWSWLVVGDVSLRHGALEAGDRLGGRYGVRRRNLVAKGVAIPDGGGWYPQRGKPACVWQGEKRCVHRGTSDVECYGVNRQGSVSFP